MAQFVVLIIEQRAGEFERRQHVFAVVFLLKAEGAAGVRQPFAEGFFERGDAVALRHVDLQRREPVPRIDDEFVAHSTAEQEQIPSVLTVAVLPFHNDRVDFGDAVVVIVDTLQNSKILTLAVLEKGNFLQRFADRRHAGQPAQSGNFGGIGGEDLSAHGQHLHIGIEVTQEIGHQILEAIEYAHHQNQGRRPNGDAKYADPRDDVDGVGAFFGEQVAAGEGEW